jgi:hypothetical protein
MIIRIVGGIGNQMFCYAFGYALAKSQKTTLKLDVTQYENEYFRSYKLDDFNLTFSKKVKFPYTENIFDKIRRQIFIRKKYNMIFEKKKAIGKIHKNKKEIYLDGYWQNPIYFDKYADDICNQFKLKNTSKSLKEFKLVADCESVSVHIRRGDYVGLGFSLDTNYFKNAIIYLDKIVKIEKIFIFSDDVEWCKKNFKDLNRLIFVNDDFLLSDMEQLIAMSFCKHHIISNSTFSWWGAFLDRNNCGIVIRPANWDNTICPLEWIAFDA